MSSKVSIELWLKDMFSGGIRKAEVNSKGALGGIGRSIDGVNSKVLGLGAAAARMNAPFSTASRSATQSIMSIGNAADAATQRVVKLNASLQDGLTKSGGGGIGKYAQGAFWGNIAAQGALRAGRAVVGLGGSVLKGGMEAGAMQEQFKVLAGDKAGAELYGGVKKYVKDSVFGPELYGNARTMLAFGITAKDVLPNLKMLGDVSMGNKEKMDLLTLAFSQTTSAGKLMGQDLLQYTTAGFNPLMVLAEKTGRKYDDLREAMSEGKISAEMVRTAFVTATSAGGKYYHMLDTMAKMPLGKLQAMQGSFEDAKVGLGAGLAPALSRLMDGIKPMIDGLPAKMERLMPAFDKAIDNFSEMLPYAEKLGGTIGSLLRPIGGVLLSDEFKDLAQGTLSLADAIGVTLKPAVKELAQGLTEAMGGIAQGLELLGIKTGKNGAGGVTPDDKDAPFFEWETDRTERLKRKKMAAMGRPYIKLPVPFFESESDYQKRLKEEKRLNAWADTGLTKKDVMSANKVPGMPPVPGDNGGLKPQKTIAPSFSGAGDAITGGGRKNITINLNQPMVGKQEFHVTSMQEAKSVALQEFEIGYLQVVQGVNASL